MSASCKITFGDMEHTVHFPDGWRESVKPLPFEDIDGLIERAISQRLERESVK